MCGVAAIFAYHSEARGADADELRLIRDRMERRGPDGAGEWISADGRCALGHRRLSIIDLSERGRQPMTDVSGALTVSFNGEIYNYRELRSELESRGRRFVSGSDTEVLLHLYAEMGEGMLPRLRGMFAFALWDSAARRLILARDAFGIKPLYYADDGRTVRVASQVKALAASPRVSRTPDNAAAAGFLLFGSVPEPYTPFAAIRSVPAGACVRIDARGISVKNACATPAQIHAAAEPREGGRDDRSAAVRAALDETVRYHFVADVPVGIFLSSGLDSAALALIAHAAGAEFTAVTLAFEEFRGTRDDESPGAADIARACGARHVTRVLTASEFRRSLTGALEAMDMPSIDGLNTYFVSLAAAEQGLKVALSGLGSDEMFGGYPFFREMRPWIRAASWTRLLPGAGRLLRAAAVTATRGAVPAKAASFFEFAATPSGAYLLRRGLFMPWELPSLMGADAAAEGLRRLSLEALLSAPGDPDPGTDFARASCAETSLYMRNQLLRDADWAGMAHSLEIRVPFADPFLLRRLAGWLKTRGAAGPKRELLDAVPELPESVVRRPKTGFFLPYARWLTDGDRGSGAGSWQREWALRLYRTAFGSGR